MRKILLIIILLPLITNGQYVISGVDSAFIGKTNPASMYVNSAGGWILHHDTLLLKSDYCGVVENVSEAIAGNLHLRYLDGLGFIDERIKDGAANPLFLFRKARGSGAGSKAIVQAGDHLGQIRFEGYTGTEYKTSGYIRLTVDSLRVSDSLPLGTMGFYLKDTSYSDVGMTVDHWGTMRVDRNLHADTAFFDNMLLSGLSNVSHTDTVLKFSNDSIYIGVVTSYSLGDTVLLESDTGWLATQWWVNDQGFLTSVSMSDLSDWADTAALFVRYADTSDMLSVYQQDADTNVWDATRDWVLGKNYLTSNLTKEQVQDSAWDVLGGTQTLITVTYQDGTDDVDFVVDNDLSNYDNTTSGFLTSESDPQVGTNTTSYIPRWDGSALVSGIIRDNNSTVGISTAPDALYTLKVGGSILITSPNYLYSERIKAIDGTGINFYDSDNDGIFAVGDDKLTVVEAFHTDAAMDFDGLVHGTTGDGDTLVTCIRADGTVSYIYPYEIAASGGGSDAFTVKVDAAATAGYIGAAYNDGVIRTYDVTMNYADSGDYVVLSVDTTYVATQDDISGFLTGNETITLSGDVTGSGTTAITTSIEADSIHTVETSLTGMLYATSGVLSTRAYIDSAVSVGYDSIYIDYTNGYSGFADGYVHIGGTIQIDTSKTSGAQGDGNNLVAVDVDAQADYLGAAYSGGVLRTDGVTMTYTDGGDFVTLGVDSTYVATQDDISSFLTGNQTITLSGDVTGSGETGITATVVDDSHNHVIGNVDNLQDSLNTRVRYSDTANMLDTYALEGWVTDNFDDYEKWILQKGGATVTNINTKDTVDFTEGYGVILGLRTTAGTPKSATLTIKVDTTEIATPHDISGKLDSIYVLYTDAGFVSGWVTDTVKVDSSSSGGGGSLTEEQVQDYAWNVLGGTQTLITVTYQDGTDDVDFVVDNDLSNYDNTTSGFLTTESDPQVGANTTNYVPYWNGSALVKCDDIYWDGTNVGIGNASPIFKLHVSGDAYVSGDFEAECNVIGTYFESDANGNAYFKYGVSGIAQATNFKFWDVHNTLFPLTIDSTGNVGIGTIQPAQRLEVLGGNLFVGEKYNDGENYNLQVVDSTNNKEHLALIYNAGKAGFFRRVSSGGAQALFLLQNAKGTPLAMDSTDATDKTGEIAFETYTSGGNFQRHGKIYAQKESVSNDGTNMPAMMAIEARDDLGNWQGIYLKSTGYVGIGTSSPNTNLQVEGGAIFDLTAHEDLTGNEDITTCNYYVLVDPDDADRTLNLPATSAYAGFGVWIKNIDSDATHYDVIVSGAGGKTIDGAATITLDQYDAIYLVCDGDNWHIMSYYP